MNSQGGLAPRPAEPGRDPGHVSLLNQAATPHGQPLPRQMSSSTYGGSICRLARVKMTGPLERVLRALLEDPATRRYGYDLMKAARVASGTLYPLLTRLEGEGLVTSHWENPGEADDALRPRKYYKLTGEGERVARRELDALYASKRRAAGFRPLPVPRTGT